MMNKPAVVLALALAPILVVTLVVTPAAVAETALPALIQITPAEVQWKDAPPTMPSGTKMAVLEGNPQRPGLFTMRLVVPRGFRLEHHTHPQDERMTVLRGIFHVVVDGKDKAFPAGSFYVTPSGVPHVVYADEETELQITGWGPWEVRPVTTSK